MASGPARAEQPAVFEEAEPGPRQTLIVETATGVWPFEVELADDPAERAQGLMFRRSLEPEHGMLFDMRASRPVGFWMKNTYVSLDMVFISQSGRVHAVAERTLPLSTDVVGTDIPTRFVLELVAGTARRIGLKAGDRIRHPAIDAVAGP